MMRPSLTAAALGFVALTASGALAQESGPPIRQRQPRPPAAETAPTTDNPTLDLDATRKRFDANSAKRVEEDRKRDEKLNHSMRSICSGCGEPAPAKRTRTPKASEPPPLRNDTSPSE